ncbi:HEAT repeat domain-containing protein [Candidatus Riflebacteria bacterium]
MNKENENLIHLIEEEIQALESRFHRLKQLFSQLKEQQEKKIPAYQPVAVADENETFPSDNGQQRALYKVVGQETEEETELPIQGPEILVKPFEEVAGTPEEEIPEEVKVKNGVIKLQPDKVKPSVLSEDTMDFTAFADNTATTDPVKKDFKQLEISSEDEEELSLKSQVELEDILKNPQNPDPFRFYALEKLEAKAGKSCIPALISAIDDCHEDQLLCRVIAVIGNYGKAENIEVLIKYLHHPIARIRAATIEALEGIGDFDCLPHIQPMLVDPDRRVQTNAAKAMGRFGQETCLKALNDLMASKDPNNRKAALYAAQYIHLPQIKMIFKKGLKDSNVEVKCRAIEYITFLRDKALKNDVKHLIQESDNKILLKLCDKYLSSVE